ncbi:hypothetical protein K435DRAFT_875980 [Dendrothele bispora CBS 962.96]|uniref:Uncharacterized protein n=1 Tax=Dendrothele bispora (strain CBS 962.96) TaxID=1314807 RepID=A0A4S8KTE6_DENBC|nr:hypothetical protein K435DRAFT_875980 [Dendrothele bispora CBS 962.96]
MSYTDQLGSPESINDRHLTNRNTNRYSVTTLFSMVAEQDVEVEDYLARGKDFCSIQKQRCPQKGCLLSDSQIALLIQNRMALDEQRKVEQTLKEVDLPRRPQAAAIIQPLFLAPI